MLYTHMYVVNHYEERTQMEKISLLAVVLATVMGSSAYAMNVVNGRLLQHKELATGGAVGYILQGKDQGVDTKRAMDMTTHDVVSEMGHSTAQVDQMIELPNQHRIFFVNDTKKTKTYEYGQRICAHFDANMSECMISTNNVELQPGGYVFDTSRPVLQTHFTKPGVHTVIALSYFFDNETTYTSSISEDYITVS